MFGIVVELASVIVRLFLTGILLMPAAMGIR